MRIVAGKHRGRNLEGPKDMSIRPTSDRTRESMFNILMHGEFGGDSIVGENVLDLCCGSGALGLEALSRGASLAIFIDKNRTALALAERNAAFLRETENCRFIPGDAASLPRAPMQVGTIFMDAPYDLPLMEPAYKSLQQQGWLNPGTILCFEHEKKTPLPALEGAELVTERVYGKSCISILRVS